MASKAAMLKNGARKTGTGLFDGMTKLKDIAPEKEVETEEKAKEVSVAREVQPPKKEEPVKQVVEDKVIEEVKEVIKSEPVQVKEEEKTPQEIVEELVKPKAEEKTVKKEEKASSQSRYEKDKFLLLDIRGYRDYVEHMAKAANMSATKYIRSLIEQDMNQNMDIYEAHKLLEEKLKQRK